VHRAEAAKERQRHPCYGHGYEGTYDGGVGGYAEGRYQLQTDDRAEDRKHHYENQGKGLRDLRVTTRYGVFVAGQSPISSRHLLPPVFPHSRRPLVIRSILSPSHKIIAVYRYP
jgi:hypothetical protein